MDAIEALTRQLERERTARKQAETLLEAKSRELYESNQQLRTLASDLEARVEERTRELTVLNQALRREMTERERTQNILNERESTFTTLFESSSVGILLIDEQSQIVLANAKVCEMFGYTQAEMTGLTVQALVPEALRSVHHTHVADYFRTLHNRPMGLGLTLYGLKKDGTEFPLDISLSFVKAQRGTLVMAWVTDLTERVRVETALREAEAGYRNLVEQLPAVMYIDAVDENATPLYVSPQIEALTGYTAQEWSADVHLWLTRIHPEDRARAQAAVKQIALTGEPLSLDYRLFTRAGEMIWLHDETRVVYDRDNKPVYAQGFLTDITARKQAEAALELSADILDSIVNLVIVGNSRGEITYMSPSVQKILGYTPQELLGQGWWQIERDEGELETERSYVMRAAAGEIPTDGKGYEHRLRHKNGEWRWLVIEDAKGPGDLIIGVGTDITERKRTEEALYESESFYHSLVDVLPLTLCRKDLQGRFTFGNPRFLQEMKCTAGELLGKTDFDFHPLQLAELYRADDLRVMESGQNFETVEAHKTLDGYEAFVQVIKTPLRDAEGQVTGIQIMYWDVTDRERIQAALRASEERYRDLVESASDIIYRCDSQGHFIYGNPVAVRLMNFKTELEALGHSYLEFVAPGARRQVSIFYANQFRERLPNTYYEFPAVTTDGRELWIGQNVQLLEQGGAVVGFQAVARDISARKQAEDALRESREQLNNILSSLDDVVWATSPADGRLLFMNAATERVYHRSVSEFIENPALWLDTIHPDDRIAANGKYNEVMHTGAVEMEHRILRPDGEVRWLYTRVTLARDATGAPTRLTGIASDITERKRAQEEIRMQRDFAQQVMSTMGQGLTVTNQSGKFEYVNPAYANMLGMSPLALIGKSPYDVTDPEFHTTLSEAWGRRNAGETTTYETRLGHVDGHSIPVLITSTPRWRNRVVQGSIAVITDLTAQKNLEQELAYTRDQALEASRLKSEFLAMMSHEIRTPMNSIVGMTELLLDTPLDEDQREFARIAHESSHALLNIINDILDFSKIEAGKMVLDRAEFDLVTLVEGSAEIVSSRAREKQLPLMTFISPDLPQWVIGDGGRLRQVLLNLLTNAVKFTDRGHVVMRIRAIESDPGTLTILAQVEDTGIGISEETQKQLFQPFMQADGSITRRYGGTGLGLAISKRIVEMMHGEIGVVSTPGKGSTFWFTARLERAVMHMQAEVELPVIRVLIVDDHPEHGMIVHKYLDSWDVPNETVTGAEEALNALRRAESEGKAFDVAILDLNMPELNGLALAQTLRSNPRWQELKLILVTAYDVRGLGEQVIAKGFSAYLTKPLRQAQLLEALVRAAGTVQRDRPAPVAPAAVKPTAERIILVVEDDAANQKMAELQLRYLGYTPRIVGDGRSAIEMLQQSVAANTPYALVLMDCQMPVMDGFTATREIRKWETQHGSHALIIAMTANAMQGDREACFAAGMDDYISKPVQIEALKQVLERWLHKSSE